MGSDAGLIIGPVTAISANTYFDVACTKASATYTGGHTTHIIGYGRPISEVLTSSQTPQLPSTRRLPYSAQH